MTDIRSGMRRTLHGEGLAVRKMLNLKIDG